MSSGCLIRVRLDGSDSLVAMVAVMAGPFALSAHSDCLARPDVAKDP